MGRSALWVLLLPALAFGQDRMHQVAKGTAELVPHPHWVLTPEGKDKLDAALDLRWREIEKLRAENTTLRADVEAMASKPALTWPAVALLVGAGVALGVGATLGVAALARQ